MNADRIEGKPQWMGSMVEAERRVVHFLATDLARTGQDVDRLARSMRSVEKRHPYAAMLVEGALFMAALLTMLLAQAYFSASHF